ncbi:MAG: DNA double-strand break repair nuclease NurA, partial [Chloroflexota bacterium]|nr:DNA double-strand break repair nuclease NurA [Chloroflexota bacterium]
MTLDMLKLGPRVGLMGRALLDRGARYPQWVAHARRQLRELARDWEGLGEVARGANKRLATPLERLDLRYRLIDPPHAYRVVATDGSQIEPDRHGIADYYVLNVGWAVIEYGPAPGAELASEPSLHFEPEDLYITYGDRRVPVQDRHLSAKRACLEMERAATLAAVRGRDGTPTVVLADGTLLLWVLEERPENFLREALLAPYVDAMDRVRRVGVPLASYISRPRHVEVTGLLREATCKRGVDACDGCAGRTDEPCVFERLPDRALFEDLQSGERSALFEMTLRDDLAVYYEG